MGRTVLRIIPQTSDTPFTTPAIQQPSKFLPTPFLPLDSGKRNVENEKQQKKRNQLKDVKKQIEPALSTLPQKESDTFQQGPITLVTDTLVKKNLPAPKMNFYTESLFKGHLLPAENDLKLKLNIKNHQYWIPAILFITLAIYAFARVRYFKRISQIMGAFSIGGFNRRSREENVIFTRASFLLMSLSILVLSLFIFHVINYYSLPLAFSNKIILFIKMVSIIILIYLVKMLVIKITGFIFRVENESKEYLINIFLFNELLGLLLLPVVIALTYLNLVPMPYLIYTGIAVVGFILVYRTVKVIILSLAYSKISKFYFFLYLCTLEILPLIVLTKLLNIKISL